MPLAGCLVYRSEPDMIGSKNTKEIIGSSLTKVCTGNQMPSLKFRTGYAVLKLIQGKGNFPKLSKHKWV